MTPTLEAHDPFVLIFASVFILVGLALILIPTRIRDVGLRSTELGRNLPFGLFQYDAVRRRDYTIQLRIIGLPVILAGFVLLLVVLRSP